MRVYPLPLLFILSAPLTVPRPSSRSPSSLHLLTQCPYGKIWCVRPAFGLPEHVWVTKHVGLAVLLYALACPARKRQRLN